MKQLKNFALMAGALCLAAAFAACGGGAGTDTAQNTAPPAGNNAPVSNNNAAPVSDVGSAKQNGVSIAGDYTVSGSNPDGSEKYEGELRITPRDDVYQFSWVSGGASSDGVGVMTGNKIAVAFTDSADGTGCGVVLYKISANGDLDGKAGYWGVNSYETETAKRKSGTDLAGEYDVSGTNTGGGEYTGTLKVAKDGEGYSFEWNTGSVAKGFGIRQNDTATVGIGGPQCAFVAYDIKPDGTLDGKWGGQKSKTFGTETAKKK